MARVESILGLGSYKVGSVSRLTGLSIHLIRAWERRYGAVTPRRSGAGTRVYSDEDVERLQLLKALVDLGEPVSQVASLSGEALRELLARHAAAARPTPTGCALPGRLALLAPNLSCQIQSNPTALGGLRLALEAAELEPFLSQLVSCEPDVIVVELEALEGDPVPALKRCRELAPEASVFVVYSFASQRLLSTLADLDIRLGRAPLKLSLLRRLLLDFRDIRRAHGVREALEAMPAPGTIAAAGPQPAPRLSDEQLAELLEVRTSVECECPSNLSRLVQELLAFERYSQRCVVEQPRDAELHELLARGTGHARSWIEALLLRVCEHDGIPVRPSLADSAREAKRARD